MGQQLLVYRLTTDDKGIAAGQCQQLLQGVDGLCPVRNKPFLPGQHQIAAIGQPSPPWEGFQRFAAHDNRMAGGKGLKALQIGGNTEQQMAVFADAPALTHGYDSLHRHPSSDGHGDLVLKGLGIIPLQ